MTGAGIKVFESNELNQTTLNINLFQKEWDYIALGHYHNFTKLQDNMYYCSSPERLSIAEADHSKGYALVELPGPQVKHGILESREYVKLEYDALTHQHDSLTDKLMEMIKFSIPKDKIVRLRIKNLSKEEWATVDSKSLQRVAKESIKLIIDPDLVSNTDVSTSTSDIGLLTEEFLKFIQENPIDDINEKEKQFILEKAQELLI